MHYLFHASTIGLLQTRSTRIEFIHASNNLIRIYKEAKMYKWESQRYIYWKQLTLQPSWYFFPLNHIYLHYIMFGVVMLKNISNKILYYYYIYIIIVYHNFRYVSRLML